MLEYHRKQERPHFVLRLEKQCKVTCKWVHKLAGSEISGLSWSASSQNLRRSLCQDRQEVDNQKAKQREAGKESKQTKANKEKREDTREKRRTRQRRNNEETRQKEQEKKNKGKQTAKQKTRQTKRTKRRKEEKGKPKHSGRPGSIFFWKIHNPRSTILDCGC